MSIIYIYIIVNLGDQTCIDTYFHRNFLLRSDSQHHLSTRWSNYALIQGLSHFDAKREVVN